MDIPATAASIMAAAQDQGLDFRTIKNEANASETNEEKEDETCWSHHQTQQPGNDHHRTANICNTITCTDMIAALENSSIIYTPTCKVLIITGFNFFCINLCYRALTSSDRVTEPSHHQTQQPGKDHHPRDHCREERQRETTITWEKDIEEWAKANIGEATRMAERRDLWCTVIDVTAAQH